MSILQDDALYIPFVIRFGQVMEAKKCCHTRDCSRDGLEEYLR
jgi:hypothetical protein